MYQSKGAWISLYSSISPKESMFCFQTDDSEVIAQSFEVLRLWFQYSYLVVEISSQLILNFWTTLFDFGQGGGTAALDSS